MVESYLESGDPVGSRNLSRASTIALSPASIRNVMAELEETGLIYAPHTSAGRLPTEAGLRLFVDGILEIGDLSAKERARIDAELRASGNSKPVENVLNEASALLSGLSKGAGIVLAGKRDAKLKHIEFVGSILPRALVVLVTEDGNVENRVIDLPLGCLPSALAEATNFLNSFLRGQSLGDIRATIEAEPERAPRRAGYAYRQTGETGPCLLERGSGRELETPDRARARQSAAKPFCHG